VVLDALGVIMSEVVEAGASVTGPNWSMAATNIAYDLARRAAAEDARHRAIAYAETLGLSLGDVAWVAEPGMRSGTPLVTASPVTMRAEMAPPAEPELLDDLTPSEMTVEVSVEVGFDIL